MPAVPQLESPVPPGVNIGYRRRVRLNAPGVGEETVLTLNGSTVRKIVARPQPDGGSSTRIGIQLRLKAVTNCAIRVDIAHGAIRVVHETLVCDRLDIEARDEVAREDLRHPYAVQLTLVLSLEQRVIRFANQVVAQ